MNAKRIIIPILICIFFAGSFSGCSLIGLGIGSLIDSGNAHDGVVPIFPNIDDCKGQSATIRYHDSIAYVTFIGYSDEPADRYKKSYDDYFKLHPSCSAAISLGDTVVTESLSFTGAFGGYFPEGIILSGKRYYFRKFDDIISPKSLSKAELRSLFELNSVPIKAILNFNDRGRDFSLTNRDFENVMITYNKSGNAKWIGLGIGAAIDVAYVIWVATLVGHSGGSFAKAQYVGSIP